MLEIHIYAYSSERFLYRTIVTVVLCNFGKPFSQNIHLYPFKQHFKIPLTRANELRFGRINASLKTELLNWHCCHVLSSADQWTVLMACITASAKEDRIARCVELLLSRNADPNMVDR